MERLSSTAIRSVMFCAFGLLGACDQPLAPRSLSTDGGPALTAANATQVGWELVDLGLANSIARDVNSQQQVVGRVVAGGIWQGFLWENGSVTYLVGFQPEFISENGLIVGSRSGRPAVWKDGAVAYLWSGTTMGVVHGVNDSGMVVGSYGVKEGKRQPFIWQDGDLEILPYRGEARAVSANGTVAGNSTAAVPATPGGAVGVWTRLPSGEFYLDQDNPNHRVLGVDNYGYAWTAVGPGCQHPSSVRPETGFRLVATACGQPTQTNSFGYAAATTLGETARLFIRASQSVDLVGLGPGTVWAHAISPGQRAPLVAGSSRTEASGPRHATVWEYRNGGQPTALPEGRDVTGSTAYALNSLGDAVGFQALYDDPRAALWKRQN